MAPRALRALPGMGLKTLVTVLLFGVHPLGCFSQLSPSHTAAANQSFTFVVLGDNRGDSSGEVSPAFREIVQAVLKTTPEFVLNTGDMIYGHTSLAAARQQWQRYRQAVAPLSVPLHHVPGNHDIWDQDSASLYRQCCGPTHWSFAHGSALFIGLDTESSQSRLGPEQFAWLRHQLAEASQHSVFVILHRPLFPADGGLGSSLDIYPAERDELHRLFVQYRSNIKAVFAGHEHFYHFEERDGVLYYTTGGAGANLYVPPELGGFHHFLVVHVTPKKVTIELKKVGAVSNPLRTPLRVKPGSLLESWEHGLVWYPWDYTVNAEISRTRATHGRRGLQLNFDPGQCPWPVLSLPLTWVPDWQHANGFAIDVYLPRGAGADFTLTPAVEGTRKSSAPTVHLKRGWNTVQVSLNETWLPRQERAGAHSIEWGLAGPRAAASMAVVFDQLRCQSPSGARVLESFERPLLWRVVDESVTAGSDEQFATVGRRGLKLGFDFSLCREPVALARLNPPWDLRKPAALAVDIFVPNELGDSVLAKIGLRKLEVSSASPPVPLRPGWNHLKADLRGNWLPESTRAAAEQVECRLLGVAKETRGWVVLDNLRAE